MSSGNILLNYWHINIPAIVIAVLLVIFHLKTNGYNIRKKSLYFLGGILLLILVTCSPVDYLAHSYLFSAHMIQHIILLLIVPPMLLAGTDTAWLENVVEKKSFSRFGKILFYPVLTWIIGIGSMYVWHVPSIMSSTMNSEILNIIHIILLLVFGVIFIWPVYTPVKLRKLHPLLSALYLFTACIGCTVLGILITFAPVGMFTSHSYGIQQNLMGIYQYAFGLTPETDQLTGGLIMWVPACIIYLVNIMITIAEWYKEPAAIE